MTRFSTAWAEIARENNWLKIVVFALVTTTLGLAMVTLRLALKPPIVIERSCLTRAISPTSAEHTPEEVESFLRAALSQRFDSDARLNGDLLSLSEMKSRDSEQAELARRQMKQRVLLNGMTRSADSILVDTDRILSVAGLRSAFVFALNLKLEATHRSVSNPYGLVLVESAPRATPETKGGNHENASR